MKPQSGKLFKLLGLWFFLTAHFAQAEYAFQMLHEFFPTNGEPAYVSSPLIEADDGNLYGTTGGYGVSGGGFANGGTVFTITPSGQFTVVHSFSSTAATNGVFPNGLVQGKDGAIYGVTDDGGILPGGQVSYGGIIFKITTNGVFTNLASFVEGTNGSHPHGALARTETGDFYGVTGSGGTYGEGAVFKATTNGTLTTLASFGGTNGTIAGGTLLQGSNGSFYGTTLYGVSNFHGTIFRTTTNGELTTLVYFNGTNGSSPNGLTLGKDGFFYGTTRIGGASNYGTFFKMADDGTLTTIFSFPATEERNPFGNIIQAPDGNFYGAATSSSSAYTNFGTLFKITPGGELSTIFYFDGTNAVHPGAYFIQARDGNLYGLLADVNKRVTLNGNAGAIFRLVEPPSLTVSRSMGGIKLTWNSFTNGIYRLEKISSWDSTNWTSISSNIVATGNSTSFTNPPVSAQEFYRVVLLP